MINKHVEKCALEGENLNNSKIVRARYFYHSFTSLLSWIEISSLKDFIGCEKLKRVQIIKKFELEYARSFLLARKSCDLLNEEYDSEFKKGNSKDKGYLLNFRLQLSVNYANVLYGCGRILKSISELTTVSKYNYPMVSGNLGLKIAEYANFDYDSHRKKVLNWRAALYLQSTLSSNYIEKSEADWGFRKKLSEIYDNSFDKGFEVGLTIDDFLEADEELSDGEFSYRIWCLYHTLTLNTLNEVTKELEIGYDPLHLSKMIGNDEESTIQYFELINQIKQEYVSARYLAYEGLKINKPHFSDRGVLLANSKDHRPIYGLGIEMVKGSYRSVYSIFDKVAHFLNLYYKVGIRERDISFFCLFDVEENKDKILASADENYPLLGLWWLFKDIKNKLGTKKNVHIDPTMSRIIKVRNAMEHRSLKITSDIREDNSGVKRSNKLSYEISSSEFEKLTISLLKYAREAIIYLVFTIHEEEKIRVENHLNNQEKRHVSVYN